MADYDWGCGHCHKFPGHYEWCPYGPRQVYEAYLADKKMEDEEGFKRRGGQWECLRGCGCVVWNVEAHKMNVCPTYAKEPVSG